MQAEEAILSRRSCRKYKEKDVPKELIEKIILAGRSAPTALNFQEVKFYALMNNIPKIRELDNKLMQNRAKVGKSNTGWMDDYMVKYDIKNVIFYDAPCLIILTADKPKNGERDNTWKTLDCGIATGNMLTMATSLGLGTCPIGIANHLNQDDVLDAIDADKNKEELLLIITVGYPVDGYKEKYVHEKELTSFVKYV